MRRGSAWPEPTTGGHARGPASTTGARSNSLSFRPLVLRRPRGSGRGARRLVLRATGVPQEQADDQARHADQHQDETGRLKVDSRDGRGHGVLQDRPDGDQEQASTDCHASRVPGCGEGNRDGQSATIASISTSAPRGRAAAWIATRAGGSSPKKSAYTSFTRTKSPM